MLSFNLNVRNQGTFYAYMNNPRQPMQQFTQPLVAATPSTSRTIDYDTGCDAIAIHPSEVLYFIQPGLEPCCIYQVSVATATGTAPRRAINVQVRALDSNNNILRNWATRLGVNVYRKDWVITLASFCMWLRQWTTLVPCTE